MSTYGKNANNLQYNQICWTNVFGNKIREVYLHLSIFTLLNGLEILYENILIICIENSLHAALNSFLLVSEI